MNSSVVDDIHKLIHEHVLCELKNDSFTPFGIGILSGGQHIIARLETPDEQKAASYVVEVLTDLAQKGKLMASAICVKSTQKFHGSDAVTVILETANSVTALGYQIAYRKTLMTCELGEWAAGGVESVIFRQNNS